MFHNSDVSVSLNDYEKKRPYGVISVVCMETALVSLPLPLMADHAVREVIVPELEMARVICAVVKRSGRSAALLLL